ncbi:hypothetical protein DPMN_113605 [Dreissena polymorpha]|uniref:Uncharacterized protein n=1 Tax=Dreissena polymorpha TaxID=45954 RepID=A0A9D4KJD1_DREPO|nr:hypothetical protein DPMN_113605 [Dreissena polymorpha]
MNDSIKRAHSHAINKTSQLKYSTKEAITDRDQDMRIWVKHNSELLSRVTFSTESANDNISDQPVMEEHVPFQLHNLQKLSTS